LSPCMSTVTVSSNKLPFAIQTILADNSEKNEFCNSKSEIATKSSAPTRSSADKNCFSQRYCASLLIPKHLCCRNMQLTAVEVASTLHSIPCHYCQIPDIKKPENRLDYSKLPRRIGHPYQSRAPACHKKPRTSFTKKQVQCYLKNS
uniref:Ovule protein n=1 Tax=Gongylonema pulchrum TaxID=637853 RepID=A0A183EP62_9BILA